MSKEIVPYDYWQLSTEHEFFKRSDFWERFEIVSAKAPRRLREAIKQADMQFVRAVVTGDIEDSYAALCQRYEATGRKIEDGTAGITGDYIGPATLDHCIEFAIFWQIDDPRLPQMEETCQLLWFIHYYENPWPGEMEDIEQAWYETTYGVQLRLFQD